MAFFLPFPSIISLSLSLSIRENEYTALCRRCPFAGEHRQDGWLRGGMLSLKVKVNLCCPRHKVGLTIAQNSVPLKANSSPVLPLPQGRISWCVHACVCTCMCVCTSAPFSAWTSLCSHSLAWIASNSCNERDGLRLLETGERG